ncbi:MAG: N-(5'-phosphoribosyl)anthranilate isomerase [Chloroflexia bacterium]
MASAWIDQIFTADAVAKGEVVRRNLGDVNRYASVDELLAEVRRQNFHLIQTGDQLIIVCNPGVLQIHC